MFRLHQCNSTYDDLKVDFTTKALKFITLLGFFNQNQKFCSLEFGVSLPWGYDDRAYCQQLTLDV